MPETTYKNVNFANLQTLVGQIKSKYATKTALEAVDAKIIETVKVNGTALAIAEKMVDILVATGSANGTIAVNNVDVSVAGLAALAYKADVSYEDLAAALKAKIDAVDTLVDTDTNKSARAIAAEEVAKVVANADTSYDTLKEIADWILNDTTGAAKMASDISDLKTKLTLGTHEVEGQQVEYANVRQYVEAVTSSFISLTALTATTTGAGNAVTALTYDNTTGEFTATKGATFTTAVTPSAAGNFATLTAEGQLADSGKVVDDFVLKSEIDTITAAEIEALFAD